MARISIYVPDDLQQRLDRHRGVINISRLVRGAIERELDLIEMTPIDIQELAGLAYRLRKQADEADDCIRRLYIHRIRVATNGATGEEA